MSVTTAIAVFFLIWWVVLFAVLPWGVRSQHEAGRDVEPMAPGTDPGAPTHFSLGRKLSVDDAGLRRDLRRLLRGLCRASGDDRRPDGAVRQHEKPININRFNAVFLLLDCTYARNSNSKKLGMP